MSRVLGVPALLLVLVAGVLSACGSDPRDDAPVLEVAWTAELPDVWATRAVSTSRPTTCGSSATPASTG